MKKMFLTRRPLEKEKEFKGTEEKFLKIKRCFYKRWELNGKTHRDGGPAIIYTGGPQKWYQNGKIHRTDGPALIDNECQEWWTDGRKHREGGPAVIWCHGTQEWWLDGLPHREGGPARIRHDGKKQYIIGGCDLTYWFPMNYWICGD